MAARVPRVCIDLTSLATDSLFRGHGSYALGLATAFARTPSLLDGLEPFLLVGGGGALRLRPLDADTLAAERERGARGQVAETLLYLLKHTAGAVRLLAGRVDLFHATDPKGNPRPPGCRVVATCHDLIPAIMHHPFSPPLLPVAARRLVERARYRAFRHVIAISVCTRRDLLHVTGLPEARVSVIHHGVDSEVFHAAVAVGERDAVTAALGGDRPYFFCVGGFDPRKQVPLLVEGFARCAGEIDELLVLGGEIGPAVRARIEGLARDLGVADRVRLLGFVPPEQLPALYRHATAHPMLSRYEGFGMTLTEAMACGCPVLALACGSVPEIVGEAALLLDAAAGAAAVGEALVRLSRDALLRSGQRAAGLARARAFTWAECAARTAAVYRAALRSRAGAATDGSTRNTAALPLVKTSR